MNLIKELNIKDDMEIAIASAILIDYKVEIFKDEDEGNESCFEHFIYFQKNEKYLFAINYRTEHDYVTEFSIGARVGKMQKYMKDFIDLKNPTREAIADLLPVLLEKLAKGK